MDLDLDDDVTAIHQALFASGAIEPLVMGGADERAWADCDLASLAENRLGDTTDPRTLDEERRELWRSRAMAEPEHAPSRRQDEQCCWLLVDGQRAGTVALETMMVGAQNLRVSSLYVYPSFRGRAVGREALRRIAREVRAHGRRGIRLDTSWSWQRTVRAYLRMGMWVRMWKRGLELRFSVDDPQPLVAVQDGSASIGVMHAGRAVELLSASREGHVLTITTAPAPDDELVRNLMWDAWSTLSLCLAMQGWPLVRSEGEWHRSRHSDACAPESLAYRIQVWEAWDRAHGWMVETPRILGLSYPTWEELEAMWKA